MDSTEGSDYGMDGNHNAPRAAIRNEDDLIASLGISMGPPAVAPAKTAARKPTKTEVPTESEHVVVPDPHADEVDLSDLRGTRAPTTGVERKKSAKETLGQDDLDALAEIVPALKSQAQKDSYDGYTMTVDNNAGGGPSAGTNDTDAADNAKFAADNSPIEVSTAAGAATEVDVEAEQDERKMPAIPTDDGPTTEPTGSSFNPVSAAKYGSNLPPMVTSDSMRGHQSHEFLNDRDTKEPNEKDITAAPTPTMRTSRGIINESMDNGSASSPPPGFDGNRGIAAGAVGTGDDDQNLGGFDDVNSDTALESNDEFDAQGRLGAQLKGDEPSEAVAKLHGHPSSNVSLSTATQTHEVRMPLYLPTFKPATGCTNASDFVVRCFVARLRSGITVVKHGRSRWCKSRLRILHIHQDGRSLSWKPAVGEPSSSKRPPKLDLSTCVEVRHAWSADPLNPMFTGTAIMRQKCEAANAHKSFALIFPKRTVDITAVTADQCKVLMEGFSALCFRLQVASLVGRGNKGPSNRSPDEEVDVATTTASVTLTNNSTSPGNITNRQKRR